MTIIWTTTQRTSIVRAVTSLLLMTALPVLLAGCSGGSSSGSAPAAGGSGTETPRPGPVTEAPQPGPGPETLTRMVMGPGGGMLEAFGGAVVITIPEGALSEDVDISVQPVTASLNGTVGWAYEFKPDGLLFAKPALLTLKLANVEDAAPHADALALAYQDANGRWRRAGVTPVAQAGDTVTFEQAHFSKWAFYEQWYLEPDSAELNTGDSLILNAMFIDCEDPTANENDCLLTPLAGNAQVSQWSVNAVVNGDTEVGTISGGGSVANVQYNAPATVPAANPVAVAAIVDLQAKGMGQVQLLGEITVLADNHWTGYLEYEFHATHNELHDDGDGHTETRVDFKSHQDFSNILSESVDDDGDALVMLELGLPSQQYQYQQIDDDHYTGEDVEGCVRHRTTTTHIGKGGELPFTPMGNIQFSVADGYASTPYVTPPPLMASGSSTTVIEGCGSSEETQELIGEEMQIFETYQSGMSSAHTDDGQHFTAQAEYPASVGGLMGMMQVRWTLIRNP